MFGDRMPAKLGLLLLFAGVFAACSAAQVVDAPLSTQLVPYRHQGQLLDIHVAFPALANAERLPIAVLLEGDGAGCQGYRAGLWRRRLRELTGHYLLAWPVTTLTRACDTDAWHTLDFISRVEELQAIVTALEVALPNRKVFLVGHSAGAHVALLFTQQFPGRVNGIANLGGGMDALRAVLLGIDRAAQRSTAATEAQLAKLQARTDLASPLWRRTVRFYQQLAFLPLAQGWATNLVPVLLVHGTEDASVPIGLVRSAAAGNCGAGRVCTFVALERRGHDLLTAEVFRLVDGWIRSVAVGGPSAR